MNTLKTAFFLTLLTLLLVFIGRILGGNSGMIIALIFAAILNLGSYWFSDKIVLGIYRAQKIEEGDNPGLYRIIRRIASQAGLPMPKIYIINAPAPNNDCLMNDLRVVSIIRISLSTPHHSIK